MIAILPLLGRAPLRLKDDYTDSLLVALDIMSRVLTPRATFSTYRRAPLKITTLYWRKTRANAFIINGKKATCTYYRC